MLGAIVRKEDEHMIYLIGCDHQKQQTYPEKCDLNDEACSTQRKFKQFLISAAELYKPELIAEEHNPELLHREKLRSIPLEVASEMCICHRFCDPSSEERNELGISESPPAVPPPEAETAFKKGYICAWQEYFGRDWPIRENFWIKKLEDYIHTNMLFICGAGHRETLRRRFEQRKIRVKMIKDNNRLVDSGIWNVDEFHVYREAYKKLRRNGFR